MGESISRLCGVGRPCVRRHSWVDTGFTVGASRHRLDCQPESFVVAGDHCYGCCTVAEGAMVCHGSCEHTCVHTLMGVYTRTCPPFAPAGTHEQLCYCYCNLACERLTNASLQVYLYTHNVILCMYIHIVQVYCMNGLEREARGSFYICAASYCMNVFA